MKPVIIFDNIIYSLQKAGGISAFWNILTNKVSASGIFDCYFLEYPGAEDNLFRKNTPISSDKIIRGKALPFGIHRILEPYLPPEVTQRPFIFHSSYYRTFTHPKARIVSTFHDLTHEHGGDGNFITRPLMRGMHAAALKKSSHIVCVSNYCRDDIKKTFRKISPKAISVAYNAPVNAGGLNEAVSGDYLLFVGARDDYKNFRFAVELSQRTGIPLKVAGMPFTSKELKQIEGLPVELFEYPDAATMSSLYQGALALIFMSEYEGFGIPITEAQSYGCPVLAFRRSAVPEIAGEGAILLNELSLDKAVEELGKLKDTNYRTILIEKGKENVKRFDWNQTAKRYIEIYSSLLSR